METSSRDVVVLGWWSREQYRISFVRLMQRELDVSIGVAMAELNARLADGKPTLIPAFPAERALDIAKEIEAMGAEVRVLSGHVGSGGDSEARDELARIEGALKSFYATPFVSRGAAAQAAKALCPDLRGRTNATEWPPPREPSA